MKAPQIKKVISLPIHNIEVTLYQKGGSISSDLLEVCPHCGSGECEMDCPDAMEALSDRDDDVMRANMNEVAEFVTHNVAMDAITSMILAHAVAGVDIENPAYLAGIQSAITSVENNL